MKKEVIFDAYSSTEKSVVPGENINMVLKKIKTKKRLDKNNQLVQGVNILITHELNNQFIQKNVRKIKSIQKILESAPDKSIGILSGRRKFNINERKLYDYQNDPYYQNEDEFVKNTQIFTDKS